MINEKALINLFVNNDLYIIPLHTIKNGKCTCGKSNCASPGKHPYYPKNWKILATSNRTHMQTWFAKRNKFNFAILTGKRSKKTNKYLTVIDIDSVNHEILNRLPKTFAYQTGSGGKHYWYWSNKPIRNSVSKLADKVDVRGVNGYVVIPPSVHKSGRPYHFLFNGIDQPIADLPLDISHEAQYFPLFNKRPQRRPRTPRNNSMGDWSYISVESIRERLRAGNRIPKGIRNTTIHRLLSSDRSKGTSKQQLIKNAATYAQLCEDQRSFHYKELMNIVRSVAKYPPNNNNFKKVNANYFHFLESRSIFLKPESKKRIEKLDEKFFSQLAEAENQNEYSKLLDIQHARNQFFEKNGLNSYPKYRNQLLSSKLKSLGFSRKRTSSGNIWNAKLFTF